MAVSRSKTAKAEERRISQIGDFKHRMGGEMELPSGFVVKVRNPGGLRAFVGNGTIPNSLMLIIQKGIKKGSAAGLEDEIMPDGKLDTKMMAEMNDLMDTIAMNTIVDPKIAPKLTQVDLDRYNELNGTTFTDIEDIRSDEVLYIDELPEDDKAFIFQWIQGGTRDLEEFRRKLEQNLAVVAKKSSSSGATE